MATPWALVRARVAASSAAASPRDAPVGDHLGQQRVVVGPDHRPGADPGVDPDAVDARYLEPVQRTRLRQVAGRGVLGQQPGLDRMAGDGGQVGLGSEALAAGDADLLLDQIDPGYRLGRRVLHLEPGVHLEEPPGPVGGDEELDGTRPDIPDRLGQPAGGPGELVAQLRVETGRGRLLDHLLAASLHAALAVVQMDHSAVDVGQDLDLDVAGVIDQLFHVHPVVAEDRPCLARGRVDGGGQVVGELDPDHPPAPSPGDRLHQHRVSPLALPDLTARGRLDPRPCGRSTRRQLVGHGGDHRRRRADEHQAGFGDGIGEAGVLGQEAVPRVDGIGPGPSRGGDDGAGVQVGPLRGPGQRHRQVRLADVERVGVGGRVHRHGADTHLTAGAEDPPGDLAPVGDEQPPHIRNTPYPVAPEIGAEWIAHSAMPSTSLVWRGSITPSSRRRPLM